MKKIAVIFFIYISSISAWVAASSDIKMENMKHIFWSISTIDELVERYPSSEARNAILDSISKLQSRDLRAINLYKFDPSLLREGSRLNIVAKGLQILVKDPSVEVRKHIARVGADRDNMNWQVIDTLMNDADPSVRVSVADALWGRKTDKDQAEIERILNTLAIDSESLVRARVALVAGSLSDQEITNRILNILVEDLVPLVREAVAKAVIDFKDQESAERLIRVLEKDSDKKVQIGAQKAILRRAVREQHSAMLILGEFMESPFAEVRAEISSAVAGYHSEVTQQDQVEILVNLMQDPDPTVRASVALVAGSLSDQEITNRILNSLMKDSSVEVRTAVASAVFFIDDRILRTLMKDSDPAVRQSIAFSAIHPSFFASGAQIKHSGRVLNILAKDSDPAVRKAVALTSVKLGYVRFLPFIFDYTMDESKKEREELLKLVRMATAKILNILMHDSDPEVRSSIPLAVFLYDSNVPEENRFLGLRAMAVDKHPLVRKSVAENAGKLHDKSKSEEVFNLLINDLNLEVVQQVMETSIDLSQEIGFRVVSQILNKHPNLKIRKEASEYVQSEFPDFFKRINSAASGRCESGFTK